MKLRVESITYNEKQCFTIESGCFGYKAALVVPSKHGFRWVLKVFNTTILPYRISEDRFIYTSLAGSFEDCLRQYDKLAQMDKKLSELEKAE